MIVLFLPIDTEVVAYLVNICNTARKNTEATAPDNNLSRSIVYEMKSSDRSAA